jgi:hypothetical protein
VAVPDGWEPPDDPAAELAAAAFSDGKLPLDQLLRFAAWETLPALDAETWRRLLDRGAADGSLALDSWHRASVAVVAADHGGSNLTVATATALLEAASHAEPPDAWLAILPHLPAWLTPIAVLASDRFVEVNAGVASRLLLAAHAHGDEALAWRLYARWANIPGPGGLVLAFDPRLAGGRPPLPVRAFRRVQPSARAGQVQVTPSGQPPLRLVGHEAAAAARRNVLDLGGEAHVAGAVRDRTFCGLAHQDDARGVTFEHFPGLTRCPECWRDLP